MPTRATSTPTPELIEARGTSSRRSNDRRIEAHLPKHTSVDGMWINPSVAVMSADALIENFRGHTSTDVALPGMSPKQHRDSRGHTFLVVPLLAVALVPTLAEADSHVHATGTIVVEEGGVDVPMRGVRVQLMDSDVVFDETIDTIHTDADGKFTLDGYGGDSGSDEKPDIYLKISMIHDGLADVTDVWGFTHTCTTETIEEFSGTKNYGTLHCKHATTSRIFYRSLLDRTFFKAETGDPFPDGQIDVMYPDIANYTFYKTIRVKGAKAMWHELGHRIRHALDGDFLHWSNDNFVFLYANGWHDDNYCALYMGFAFNEGFAKFHKTYFDEAKRNHYRDWTPIAGGHYCEANVAHDLVLLSERKCSDGSVAGFWRMYQTLKQNPGYIHSTPQFVEKFERLFPECWLYPGSEHQAITTVRLTDDIDWTLIDYLNWADQNSAERWQGRMPSWMPREAQHIWDLAETERHHWDTTARATFRSLAADYTRYADGWFRNGTLDDQGRNLRAQFVTTIASQRIGELTSIRTVLAGDIRATPAGPLRDLYVKLDARYAQLISSLQGALAAPASRDVREGILPASFSSGMFEN
jgi:hypothetical protein